MMSAGQVGEIVRLCGGRGPVRRLTEMGVVPGAWIEVLSDGGGPMIVRVGGTRLGLAPGIARRVLVRPR
ncbi:MAG: FeoA family protein [Armatimonadota bacterium]|nr:FeoA family protein [Armatimonadota bacterium]